ncbi:MAG: methylthioribulose 1-phosphate dehydratase [Thiohalomonadaceae bacterium]
MSASAERAVHDDGFAEAAEQLVRAGTFLFSRGWVPATSGNFSARLPGGDVAITVSGRHKGYLTPADIMRVDGEGRPVATDKRPSAETLLHTQLYARFPEVGAVLHTHSRNATLLSRKVKGQVVLEGYELLKAFRGIDTHDTSVVVPVFPNDQDIPRLAAKVEAWLDTHPRTWGYLIAGHGLYTWGVDVQETLRHLEAFEFLFDCELTTRG